MKHRFKLPVAHTAYSVVLTKNSPRCDGEEVQGYVNFTDRRISVHRQENPDTTRACLWHEFFHAVLHELGQEALADNETLVEGLALAVMRVRTEQPEI